MKKIIMLTGILIPLFVNAQNKINWVTIEEAQQLVKEEPRKVFTFVYADWCDHCEKMQETTLTQPEIIDYINANFYPVKFNAETSEPVIFNGRKYVNPNPGQHKSWNRLALSLAVFDGAIGFPTLVFFDEQFNKVMKPTRGFKSVENLNSYLKFVGENIYQTTSYEEYDKSLVNSETEVCN